MDDKNLRRPFAVDRDGEIFENDLTEETMASPAERDEAAHEENLTGEQVDSQADDRFMHDRAQQIERDLEKRRDR